MKYRELARLLRNAGFTSREGKGDHEVWSHPALQRPVVITHTKDVSPGVTRNALKAIEQVKNQEG